MIKIINKEQCSGCYACVSVCTNNCISMKFDKEGFWYPEVNEDICVQCGLCEKICPVIKNEYVDDKKVNAYVAYSKNEEIRMKSSSGGLFTVFAQEVLSKGGVVFGAAFNNEFLVYHVVIENIEDLKILQGSKYLQSQIGDMYKEAKNFLTQGRKVLFSGTACQIAGLKSFLGKDFNNLFTIDVLCHGVPSQKVWERYLKEKEKEYKSLPQQVQFRNKSTGWKMYSLKIRFSNSKTYSNMYTIDDYMKLFLSNICLRPSCYDCKFKSLNRHSDVTLGDCWGIENYIPDMDNDEGTSIILTHSEKGKKMLLNLIDKIKLKEVEVDKALPPTADSRKSVKAHVNREKFFQYLNKDACISKLVKLTEPSFMKKCIWRIQRIIK